MYKKIKKATQPYKEQFDYFQLTSELLSSTAHVFTLSAEQRQRYAAQTLAQMSIVMKSFDSLNRMHDTYLSYISSVLNTMLKNKTNLLKQLHQATKRHKKTHRMTIKVKQEMKDEINQIIARHEKQKSITAAFFKAIDLDANDANGVMTEMDHQVESELDSISDTAAQLNELQEEMHETKGQAVTLQKEIKHSVTTLNRTLQLLDSIFKAGGVGAYAGVTLNKQQRVEHSLKDLAAGFIPSPLPNKTFCAPLDILHQQLNQIAKELSSKSVAPHLLKKKMRAIAEIFNKLHGQSISKADFSSLNNAECQSFFMEVNRLGGLTVYLERLSNAISAMTCSDTDITLQSDAPQARLEKVTNLFIQYLLLSNSHPKAPLLPYLKRMSVLFNVVKSQYDKLKQSINSYSNNYKIARHCIDDMVEKALLLTGCST